MNNKTIWKTAAAVLLLILVVSSVIWMAGRDNRTAVSYTHLDVYKRQLMEMVRTVLN